MYLSSEKGGFKVSIIKGAGEGLIYHRPKSTNVFIVGEGWIQSVNYKRGRGGADLPLTKVYECIYHQRRVGSRCRL